MKIVKLLCVAILGIVCGTVSGNELNASPNLGGGNESNASSNLDDGKSDDSLNFDDGNGSDDSSNIDVDYFAIAAEFRKEPSPEDKVDFYNRILNEELSNQTLIKPSDKQQLLEKLQEKIRFLPTTICLKTLKESKFGYAEREILEKIIIDSNADETFVNKLKGELDQIISNPIGRSIIRCIIEAKTAETIVFVPISGFLDPEKQTITPAALSVIDGEQYLIITVPLDMKIQNTCLIGLSKKSGLLPTIIRALPFHAALAHELIHCMHCIHERKMYTEGKKQVNGVGKIFTHKAKLKEGLLDFDIDEELYTVLGVRAIDFETQQEMQIRATNSELEKYIGEGVKKLVACGISELMYDLFDRNNDFLRILYYNKGGGEDISTVVEVRDVLDGVCALVNGAAAGIIKKEIDTYTKKVSKIDKEEKDEDM